MTVPDPQNQRPTYSRTNNQLPDFNYFLTLETKLKGLYRSNNDIDKVAADFISKETIANLKAFKGRDFAQQSRPFEQLYAQYSDEVRVILSDVTMRVAVEVHLLRPLYLILEESKFPNVLTLTSIVEDAKSSIEAETEQESGQITQEPKQKTQTEDESSQRTERKAQAAVSEARRDGRKWKKKKGLSDRDKAILETVEKLKEARDAKIHRGGLQDALLETESTKELSYRRTRKEFSGPLDPRAILHLYDAQLPQSYIKKLSSTQRKVLAELTKTYGPPRSATYRYLKHKLIERHISSGLDHLENKFKEGSIKHTFIQKLKEKRRKKRLFSAAADAVKDMVGGRITRAFSDAKTYLKSVRVIGGGIRAAETANSKLSAIKTGISGKWNTFTESGPIRGLLEGKSLIQNAFWGIAKTGIPSSLSIALAVAISPEILPSLSVVTALKGGLLLGSAVGTTTEYMKRATSISLSTAKQFSQFNWLNKLNVRLSLHNIENMAELRNGLGELSWIKNPANREIVKALIEEKGIDNLINSKALRRWHNAFKSFGVGAVSFGIGAAVASRFGIGSPLWLGIGASVAATTTKMVYHEIADRMAIKIATTGGEGLLSRLHLLQKFPAFAMVDVVTGASTIENILYDQNNQFKGWGNIWKEQAGSTLFGLQGTRGLLNLLGVSGYLTGTVSLGGFLSKFILAAKFLPLHIKLAPLITVGTYVAFSLLTGTAITAGGLIAAAGLGVAITGVSLLVGFLTGTGPVGFLATHGLLSGLVSVGGDKSITMRLGSLIDKSFDKVENSLLGIENIVNMYQLYKVLKSLLDFLTQPLTDISGYLVAVMIAISFATIIPTLAQIIQISAETTPTIQPDTESDKEGIYFPKTSTDTTAQAYMIPTLSLDCSLLNQNNLNTLPPSLTITDMLVLENQNTSGSSTAIKLSGYGQTLALKGLKNFNGKLSETLTPAELLRFCDTSS